MSLSRRMRRAAFKQNMKAAANKQNNAFFNNKSQLGQDDAFLSNILSQIGSKPFLKKVLLNAISLTLMATTPIFAKPDNISPGIIETNIVTQSYLPSGDDKIIGVSGTNVAINGTTYTINTADENFKGNTAFNAFKKFQLDNDKIANMMVGNKDHTNIENVVNFVGSKINIDGVLNTIKVLDNQGTQKLGGNLYFLSSDGIVIGSTGVVNTGSFFAIVPNKEFMDKFIEFKDQSGNLVDNPAFKDGSLLAPNDDYQASGQQATVNNIIDAIGKVSEGFDGITLDEKGSITINGKINAKNKITLFAARKYDANANSAEQATNIIIGPDAQLNVLSKDVFGSYVNLTNEEFVEDGEFQDNAVAGVYIQSVGFKGENATSGGYANGIKTEGVINSRSTVQMVSSNYFGQNGDNGTDISDVRGNISLSGKINAPDGAFVQAQNGDINLSDKAVVANNQTTYKSAEIKSKILHLTTYHGDIKNSVHEGNDTDHQLVDNFEHNDYYNTYLVNAHDGEVNLSKTNIDSGNATLVVTATKGIALKNATTNSGRIEINNSINHGEYTNEVSGNITVTGNLSTNLKNNDTNNQLVQGVGLIQVSNGAANSYITEGEYMPQRDLNVSLNNVSATNVNIKAYGDVEVANITGSENTNEYVQNDIHIKAANNLNVAGTIETFNGDVTIEAGNVATINSVNANGELKVDADSIDKINAEAQRIKIFTNKGANIGTLKSKTDSNDGNIGPIFVQNRSKADLNPAFENLTTALDKYKEFMERAIAMVDKLIELHPEDNSLRGIKGDLESQLIDFDRFRRYGDEGAKIDYYSDSNYGYSNFEYKYKSVVMNAENVHSQYQSLLENSNYQSDLSNEYVASLKTAAQTAYEDATARWEVAKVSDVTLPTTAPTGNITLAGEIDARNAETVSKKGYVTVENFGGDIILGTSETPAIIKGAAVTLTAKAIEDVVDGLASSIETTEKSVKDGMEYDQNPTFFTATNGNITLTNTELTLRSGLIAEANGSVTLSKLKSYNNIVDDPNVVIVKANSGITTNSFSATGENEVSLENTKVVYDYEQALNDVKAIYTLIKDDTNIDSNIRDAIKERILFAEKYLNEGNVEEVRWKLSDAIEQCNNNAVTGAVSSSIDVPANMEVYAINPSGAITVGDVKNTLNSNSGDINIINDGGKIVVNGDINGNSVNLSSVGQIELNNSEMQVGNITMTAKGIEDVDGTTNSIKANNSGDSMYQVMTLTATNGNIALSNTTLNSPNGFLVVNAEAGSVTIEKDIEAADLKVDSAKGVTLGNVTTKRDSIQVKNTNKFTYFDYEGVNTDINTALPTLQNNINSLNNILQLVSGQDIATQISTIITNLNTALNNIKTKAQAHEDVSNDWANARQNLSELSSSLSSLVSMLRTIEQNALDNGHPDTAMQVNRSYSALNQGIIPFITDLKDNRITDAKLESYNVTENLNEAVTLKGAINAHTSDEDHLGSVTISNNGGDVVLDGATINAGAVTMTGKGIVDAANTTNTITANGNGNNNNENSNAVIALTATEDDVELANTTLTAAKAGIYVTAQKGAVTLVKDVTAGSKEASEQETSKANVNVQAHAGITVGDVFASGNQGITLSNNLTVEGENQQPLYATGNIVAGDLTAQEIRKYGDNQQKVLKKRIAINNNNSPFENGFLQDEDRNVTLNNVTGSVVSINALGEVSTAVEQNNAKTIEGDLLQINANSIDVENIEGDHLQIKAKSIDVENIKGKQANLNADTLVKATDIDLTSNLNIGSEMTPVDTVEIGSIQAGSVSINTNQGATYGNITTTGGEQGGINLRNVNKEVKVNEGTEVRYATGNITIAGTIEAGKREIVSEDPRYEGVFEVSNAGGNVVLGKKEENEDPQNAIINAGAVTMTGKGFYNAEGTENSINADNSLSLCIANEATGGNDGNVLLDRTNLNANGDLWLGNVSKKFEANEIKLTKGYLSIGYEYSPIDSVKISSIEAFNVDIYTNQGATLGNITTTGGELRGINLRNVGKEVFDEQEGTKTENAQNDIVINGALSANGTTWTYDETLEHDVEVPVEGVGNVTVQNDGGNIVLGEEAKNNQEAKNATIIAGAVTMTGKGIVDAPNTTNTITANGEYNNNYNNNNAVIALTATEDDVELANTTLTAAKAGIYVTAENGSITLKNITGKDASLNADTLVKATDINIESGLNIGEMTPVDTVQIGSIQAGSVSINTNQGATYGNITITENNGEGSDNQNQISLSNVNKYDFEKINESYTAILNSLSRDDRDTVEDEFTYSLASAIESRNGELALEELAGAYQMATDYEADLSGISVDPEEYITEAQNDITLKGAFQLSEENESEAEFSVNVYNEGGNIVLGSEGENATINAGKVTMTAKGIKDAENTTNSITANGEGDTVLSLTSTLTDIALSNTTLNAPKGGLFATAENASVKITKDMEVGNVNVYAHSGIEVGDITATGDNGITLSNTLSVENQQTPEEATGDITAGKLTAQYEMDQQTYGGRIQITNKSEQEMISEQSQTSTEDERNINLTDVTGGEIIISGKDNLTSTGKIEGDYINISSAKTDLNELEGNDFYFDVGELNANSIKAKSEYGLNVGYYKQPVFKADIGSIEATSVNINTNQGVTIGNISITDNSQDSDFPNKISINNVDFYDFEKCNNNYNAILDALSYDDAMAVSSEYGSSFNSAVISGNIEEALEALDGALQMAKGKGATLTGISVDSADYIIKEAENDITIKGAFQLATSNDDSDTHSSMIAEESKFNVKVLNQGGDIVLDGATIDAGTVTMTAENITDTEDVPNSIIANMKEQSDSSSSDNESINALELTAKEGDISLANTVIKSNGDSLISAVSGDVKVEQDIYSGNDLSIKAENAILNNVEAGNDIKIIAEESLTSTGDMESGNNLGILTLNAEVNNVQAGNTLGILLGENLTSTGDIVADGKVNILAGDITTANGIYGENVILSANSLALGDVVAINGVEINSGKNISADNIAGNNVLLEATTVDKIATIYSESELNIDAKKINSIEEIKAPSVEITTTNGMKLGDVEILSESGSFVAKNLEEEPVYQSVDVSSLDNNESEEAGNNIEINSVIIDKSDSEQTIEPSSSELVSGSLGYIELIGLEGEGTEVSEEEGNIKIINEIGDVKVNETLTAKNVDVSAYGSMNGSAVINAEEKVTVDAGENVEVAEINAENVEISAGGDVEAGQVNADNVSVIAENNIGIDSIEGKEVTLDAGGDMELAEVSAEKVEAFAGGNLGANGIEGKEVTLSAGENVNVAEVTGDEVAVNAGSNMIVGNISGNKVLLTAKGDIEAESFDVGEKLTVEAENVNIGEAVAEGLIDLTANGELEAESLVTGDEMVAMATNAYIGEAVAGNYMQIGVIGNLTAENLESSGDMDIVGDRINLGDAEAGENLTITSIPINQFVENVVADVSNTDTSNESDADLVAENLKAGKYLIVSAEKAEIGNAEGSFVKIGALDGIEVDTVTAKASGDDKYDAVIYNAETGDINVNNVKVENGNVKVVNMAEDGNVAMKDVTAGNIYATSMNDLTVDSAKATSENNNSIEDVPYTSGLYLEGQKVTVNSAESASDYMKIEGDYVEFLDKDGKLSKIYKENPVLEEGVDVYRFADDVVDVPETMTDTLENLVEAGKIILCTKEEPQPEPTPEPGPEEEPDMDIVEITRRILRNLDDKAEAQGSQEDELNIDLNMNVGLDLGGKREDTVYDTDGGNNDEHLHIGMNEDGSFSLVPDENNGNVNVGNDNDDEDDDKEDKEEEGTKNKNSNGKLDPAAGQIAGNLASNNRPAYTPAPIPVRQNPAPVYVPYPAMNRPTGAR